MLAPANTSAASETLDRERDRPHPLQIELYRRATPTQKLAVVARLNATAIALKEASLLARWPDTPAAERREALRRWWLGARD
jgi:hypothetical protein